jgi:hypothetical protein
VSGSSRPHRRPKKNPYLAVKARKLGILVWSFWQCRRVSAVWAIEIGQTIAIAITLAVSSRPWGMTEAASVSATERTLGRIEGQRSAGLNLAV